MRQRSRLIRVGGLRVFIHEDAFEKRVRFRGVVMPQRIANAENVENQTRLRVLLLHDTMLEPSVAFKDGDKPAL